LVDPTINAIGGVPAVEDQRVVEHGGVDPGVGLGDALGANRRHDRLARALEPRLRLVGDDLVVEEGTEFVHVVDVAHGHVPLLGAIRSRFVVGLRVRPATLPIVAGGHDARSWVV
jgi:hypothetical protein